MAAKTESKSESRLSSATRPKTGERIAKAIARAGLCSRREAEAWIAAGRVAVNGKVIASPARNVTADDRIEVDGEVLPGPRGHAPFPLPQAARPVDDARRSRRPSDDLHRLARGAAAPHQRRP